MLEPECFFLDVSEYFNADVNNICNTFCCLLIEIQKRYYKLQDKAGRKLDTLGKQLTKHKVLETDIAKAESWLNDSQPIASQPMNLQCPIQAMQAQLEQQQVKVN